METLGNIIMIAGIIFMAFGIIGIFKFKNFYPRILVAAKIDTVGALTVMIGLIIQNGASFFSLKILLLLCIMLLLNPLASHMLTRSAFLSGYEYTEQNIAEVKKGHEDEDIA